MVKEILLGRSQGVRVDRQQTEEVRVTSGLPQGSVLVSILFVACVNIILAIIESNMRQFADDCIMYRKIMDNSDIDRLQRHLNSLGNKRQKIK